jgi:RNA polymerase sigma factor (sigma-70 family)
MTEPKKTLTRTQQELVNEHIALVENLARRHRAVTSRFRLEYEDLVSEGFLALIQAAMTWDPKKAPFIPYAVKLIKHQFAKADRAENFPVHLSADAHRLIRILRNAHGKGYTSVEQLVEVTGINPEKIRELAPYIVSPRGAIQIGPGAPDEATYEPVDDNPSPEDVAVEKNRNDIVREAVATLPQPTQSILKARFGFTTGSPMDSQEIQEFLGVSAEQVVASDREAITALETILRDRGLDQ